MSDEEIIEVVSVLKANDKTMKDSGISDNLWGKAVECIMFLQSENAKLRARLDKAVELPCKVGDTVYKVYDECNGSDCPYNGAFGQWRCNYKGKDRCKAFIDTKAFHYSDISSINKTIFVSKEAAEAHLAKLKK